ncbi:hypothetical protein EK21DRAFT_89575 [Setomelanomma holmii]|uniref:Uncharacterized protein n=1 Tax=Setomelanomma holmii TaxID=210430 RepID=A0A9P4HA18_9PLEO|nr:hypothetical protein EK21DRAFT_89575 [Setomelanomma holmii]
MSSTTISNHPARSINWADDDEDDFDFEAWKATADTSAPTAESLPPLQLPPAEDVEPPLIVCGGGPVNEAAPWATELLQDAAAVRLEYEAVDWKCGQSQVVFRAVNDRPAPPAYLTMSTYDGDMICFHQRVNYSHNWQKAKVYCGMNCKIPAMHMPTPLRMVTNAQHEEEVKEPEMLEVVDEMSVGEISDSSVDGGYSTPSTPPTVAGNEVVVIADDDLDLDAVSIIEPKDLGSVDPYLYQGATNDGDGRIHKIKAQDEEDIRSASALHQDITEETTSSDSHTDTTTSAISSCTSTLPDTSREIHTADKDLYTSSSATTPPILPTVEKDLDTPTYVTNLGISPASSFITPEKSKHKHTCTDSMDPLKEFCEQREVDIDNDGPLDAVDLEDVAADMKDASPDVRYISESPSAMEYIVEAAATGWFYASSMPWTTAALVTAGCVVGSALHFARRR